LKEHTMVAVFAVDDRLMVANDGSVSCPWWWLMRNEACDLVREMGDSD
jgi:hypothetical protein